MNSMFTCHFKLLSPVGLGFHQVVQVPFICLLVDWQSLLARCGQILGRERKEYTENAGDWVVFMKDAASGI